MSYQVICDRRNLAQEGMVIGMEMMFVVNALTAAGFVIAVPAAVVVWNQIGRSGRWSSSKEAMNDQDFWSLFLNRAKKKGQR